MSYSEELFYKETNEALSLYVTKERLIEASNGELKSVLQLDKYFPKKGNKVDVDINNLSMPSKNFITAIYLKYFSEDNEVDLIKDILTQNQKIYDAKVRQNDIERLAREKRLKRTQLREIQEKIDSKNRDNYRKINNRRKELPVVVKNKNFLQRIIDKIKKFFKR